MASIQIETRETDIFTHLRRKHREVSALIGHLANADGDDGSTRERIFRQVREALETHSQAEATVFYRQLRDAGADRDLLDQAEEEHDEIAQLLDDISGTPVDDDEWIAKILELQDIVDHHVAEEEDDVFMVARDLVTPEQAIELAVRMRREESRLRASH